LYERFRGHGAVSRAAFLVQKAQHFAQRIRIAAVPQERSGAAHIHQPDLAQFFQMMGKRRGGDPQLFLDFACHHTRGVSGKQQAHDLQSRLGANGGEAVGAAGDQERIRSLHISIIAEIWK